MNYTVTEKTFNQFAQTKVLLVGDAMIDSYVYGNVNRISSEAPVPVLSVTNEEKRLGGVGNVALNIKAMGAMPYLFTVVGDDYEGDRFCSLAEQYEINTQGVQQTKYRKTIVKTRMISRDQHLFRADSEAVHRIHSSLEERLIKDIEQCVITEQISIIIFADYDKGVLNSSSISRIKWIAEKYNILTAAAPKRSNFLSYSRLDLFKPNLREFNEGLSLKLDKSDILSVAKSADAFIAIKKHKNLFITLSDQGIFYISDEGKAHMPAKIKNIVDVSGAGDTVLAVASLALTVGLPPQEIATMSNIAGELVCMQVGVVPIDCDQLKMELQSHTYLTYPITSSYN